MSSHVTPRSFTRILGLIDLIGSMLMLTYPALFAELIYPQLTPYGVILTMKLFGWWHFGRGVCVLIAPGSDVYRVAGWLWMASIPAHVAAIFGLSPMSIVSTGWHLFHLILATLASRALLRPLR